MLQITNPQKPRDRINKQKQKPLNCLITSFLAKKNLQTKLCPSVTPVGVPKVHSKVFKDNIETFVFKRRVYRI